MVWACSSWAAGAPVLEPDTPVIRPSADGRLVERPWPEDDRKFHFAILGDRWGGSDAEWPVFDRAVDEINLLRPDFVIMVGDLIDGYSEDMAVVAAQWADFRRHADRLEVPLFLLPGNHDIGNPAMLRWWQENVGRTHYAFAYQGCLFLVLNTQEAWAAGRVSLGAAQAQFALEALERRQDVRHTFVFMHVPLWHGGDEGWRRIEAALADRPHTVFAGHRHNVAFEQRQGARYIVVGATKGVEVAQRNPLPEAGRFAHFTSVTVDGEAVHIAFVEPGRIWPADVAPQAFKEAVGRLVAVEARMPEGLDEDEVRTGLVTTIDNGLPEPVNVTIALSGVGTGGWPLVQGQAERTFDVAPASREVVELGFAVPPARLLPVPRIRCAVTYKGVPVQRLERNVHLFPVSALRWAPEWQVIGPFEAGPLPRRLPAAPRTSMPEAYVAHGPEPGYVAGATFQENEQTLTWQPLPARPEYGPGFVNLGELYGVPFEDLAYASSIVHSPARRRVYARFRVDDYGQIIVNGRMIEDERLYRTRSDPTWVALDLEAGWNTVVVKVFAITGGWTFRLLLADPEDELQFASGLPE